MKLRLHLSVRARLIATYVLLVVAVAGVSLVVLERTLSRDLVGALDNRLQGQAAAVAAWLKTGGAPDVLAPRFGAMVGERLLVGFALAVAAALVLGLLAVRAVTRPLVQMTRTAERLARGDYDVPAPRDSPDELGVLSRTLASLAGEVERRVGELTEQRD